MQELPPSMNLTILTFNWHEPYLCLLSEIGHEFLVVEPEISPGNTRHWDTNMRPLPENVRLISSKEALRQLDRNSIDLVIAHNVKDLIEIRDYTLPKILVFHNRLSTEIALGKGEVDREDYLSKIQPFFKSVKKVFISESKRSDWEFEGKVILPGIDVDEFEAYTGENSCVLRVGNLLKERDLMLGFTASEMIVAGFPAVTLGLNPSIPEARLSKGFQDLKDHYRTSRLYLNTTVDGHEDGYNLAMLEAMATGMPVISTSNRTSPIENGVSGYVSNDIHYLRSRVAELLADPEKARSLGVEARKAVTRKFGKAAFLKAWTETIQESIVEFLEATGVSLNGVSKNFHEKPRKNILMNYVSYPVTTAHYMERALRKEHNVVTAGAMITPEIIQQWNLEALNWNVTPQDIPCAVSAPLSHMLSRLAEGWKPDLYLWVETGLGSIPPDLQDHSIPKACYLIDSHIHFDRHKEIARQFDFVFLAQKAYVEPMQAEGCERVFWLPLGCDPEIHGEQIVEEIYDVGFVGSVTPAHVRRKKLLDRIDQHFSLHCDRKFMDEMAAVFAECRIVFNEAVNNDLNMRVFEALCSGRLLVTDEAPGSGLEDLFHDKKHLIIYNEDNLIERIRYYLDHPDERLRIAREGREEVLNRHTYDHRAKFMLETLDAHFRETVGAESGSDKPDSYYQNVRMDILPLVPENASCILEIGCAAGGTGRELKKRGGVFVAGVEQDPKAARLAREVLDDVMEGNIETLELPYAENSFDCILFADVLEHLIDPLAVLKKCRKYLKPEGTVVASLPNVQFFGVVHQLAEGNWTYQKEGILDETHLRFFTFKEMEKFFAEAGFEINQVDETLDPGFKDLNPTYPASLNIGRVTINDLSEEEFRRFFVFQYKIAARQKLTVSQTEETSEGTGSSGFSMEEMLANGKFMEQEKNFEGAARIYHQLQEAFPDCLEAICGEANCRMYLQNPEQAETLYSKALHLDANNFSARMGLSSIDLQKGDLNAAIVGFHGAREIQPDNDSAWSGLGLAYRQKAMKPEALDCFVHALAINIENPLALKGLMELAYEMMEFSECEKALKNYLKLHPANLNMLFGLAGIQYKMNKLGEALEALEQILVLDPVHKDARDFKTRLSLQMSSAVKKKHPELV
jgi:glycosyltransferase involved in cell wall biosynthesis/tetratricopeptide (TPR) repeat protein/precorrin-6B methylase 2